jgi:hypothetical protein
MFNEFNESDAKIGKIKRKIIKFKKNQGQLRKIIKDKKQIQALEKQLEKYIRIINQLKKKKQKIIQSQQKFRELDLENASYPEDDSSEDRPTIFKDLVMTKKFASYKKQYPNKSTEISKLEKEFSQKKSRLDWLKIFCGGLLIITMALIAILSFISLSTIAIMGVFLPTIPFIITLSVLGTALMISGPASMILGPIINHVASTYPEEKLEKNSSKIILDKIGNSQSSQKTKQNIEILENPKTNSDSPKPTIFKKILNGILKFFRWITISIYFDSKYKKLKQEYIGKLKKIRNDNKKQDANETKIPDINGQPNETTSLLPQTTNKGTYRKTQKNKPSSTKKTTQKHNRSP